MSFAEWQKHHYELLVLFELLKVPPNQKKKVAQMLVLPSLQNLLFIVSLV